MMCVMYGDWVTFIRGICFVCDGVCKHLHDLVGFRANLGTLGEHMYLEHFACVYSYVGIAWPDAWFMEALLSSLCCRSHCISYLLLCMVRMSGSERYGTTHTNA